MMSLINRLAAVRREDRSGKNDRLVRRLVTGGELAIDLRLGGKGAEHSRPVVAEVIDISLTGFLVRITGNLKVQPGSMVTLGEDDNTAVCRVAHANSPAGSVEQELGLHITEMSDQFRTELHAAVAALRKDHGQMREAWYHSR